MTRVLIAQIMHETNGFSRLPTTLESYRARYLLEGDAIPGHFKGTSTEIGALLEAAPRFGWTLDHPIAANATPSGKVETSCWGYLKGKVMAAAERKPDAVVLALHGAMMTEECDDAEGELLSELRALLGERTPIVATLDLHANVTDRMAAAANALIAYRTYPHVDQHERAGQAAALVDRWLASGERPRCHVARRATLDGFDHGRTTTPGAIMPRMLARAAGAEGKPGVDVVSLHAGFAWADFAEVGPSVAVSGGDPVACRRIADELADDMYRTREETTVRLVPVADAVAEAKRHQGSGRPTVLADMTDNPGGGAYGDATRLLGAMIEAKLENAALASIADPACVAACRAAGQGATIDLRLGGKIDPSFGEPLSVAAVVEKLSEGTFVCEGPMWKGLPISLGDSALIRIGGVRVVVASHRVQITDRNVFRLFGVEPGSLDTVAVKSAQHFRAAYQPTARAVIVVDSGALCSPDYRRFSYGKLRRPIWPLDS
ncbi:MAG: M81 family metallopeptidase [Alphaproteobacteria bacterium]|nr:M81 family metallopeptidase [Alphaproteobacteria bacterium]